MNTLVMPFEQTNFLKMFCEMLDIWKTIGHSYGVGKLPQIWRLEMESLLITVLVTQILTLWLLMYTTIRYAYLKRTYRELYKVNKLNLQRFANSIERPF